jgi:CheY-like chemotaxis protein
MCKLFSNIGWFGAAPAMARMILLSRGLHMSKILVVDDYPEIGAFLMDAFLAQGWHVTYASNGQEALHFLEQETGWLILLDLIMPDMDGFELLRTLQATPTIYATNTLVVMTARQLSSSEQEIVTKAGAKAILTKPFDLDMLLQTMARWLSPLQLEEE